MWIQQRSNHNLRMLICFFPIWGWFRIFKNQLFLNLHRIRKALRACNSFKFPRNFYFRVWRFSFFCFLTIRQSDKRVSSHYLGIHLWLNQYPLTLPYGRSLGNTSQLFIAQRQGQLPSKRNDRKYDWIFCQNNKGFLTNFEWIGAYFRDMSSLWEHFH